MMKEKKQYFEDKSLKDMTKEMRKLGIKRIKLPDFIEIELK